MSRTLITNGRVIDPASGTDKKADIAIADGKVAGIGAAPAGFEADRTIDAAGCVVAPMPATLPSAMAMSAFLSVPDAGSMTRPLVISVLLMLRFLRRCSSRPCALRCRR